MFSTQIKRGEGLVEWTRRWLLIAPSVCSNRSCQTCDVMFEAMRRCQRLGREKVRSCDVWEQSKPTKVSFYSYLLELTGVSFWRNLKWFTGKGMRVWRAQVFIWIGFESQPSIIFFYFFLSVRTFFISHVNKRQKSQNSHETKFFVECVCPSFFERKFANLTSVEISHKM